MVATNGKIHPEVLSLLTCHQDNAQASASASPQRSIARAAETISG